VCKNNAEREISDINLETGKVCMCIRAAIPLLQPFLPSKRRKSCHAGLPLLSGAVKLHLLLFLLPERRKSRNAALPLLLEAVSPHLPLFLLSERRKSCLADLPLLLAAVKLHLPLFLLSERRKTGTQTQDRFVSLFCFPFYILIWSREGA